MRGESYETIAPHVRRCTDHPDAVRDPKDRRTVRTRGRHERQASVTEFKDPHRNWRRHEAVRTTRERRRELNGTLYLPSTSASQNCRSSCGVPARVHHAATAAQVTGSHTASRRSSAPRTFLLTQGYAIFDDPRCQSSGGRNGHDNYVQQLVASAEAPSQVVEMGVTDRDHIGVGGQLRRLHDGQPPGTTRCSRPRLRAACLQSDADSVRVPERTPHVLEVPTCTWTCRRSATRTDQGSDPVDHGEADDNSGTFPIQSNGCSWRSKDTAQRAYVTLPPRPMVRGRESVMHTLAEMINWFDKYVKKARSADVLE